ncbi:MAG: methyltransferase [Actinobacteria bacterium]|nr:methyltransferase [Actinomycetota bacterium]MBO0784888.1 methyltransferase [Actinomycetota bacterium]
MAVLGSGSLAAYWRFHRAVAAAQLAAWLPAGRRLLVDISGPRSGSAAQAAAAGHRVVRVRWAPAAPEPARAGEVPRYARAGAVQGAAGPSVLPHRPAGGRMVTVAAEPASLACLAGGCADGVIADDSALSRHLMAEDLAAEIARVLRPGGELLCCVDSLVLGMAILAEQHRWAHLTDLPHAEVVLVPWPDGSITRCFGTAQFRDLLTEAGLDVRWIRPRTVLSPSAVDHVLRREPGAVARLVRAELAAGAQGSAGDDADEPFGIYLLAAARKPG